MIIKNDNNIIIVILNDDEIIVFFLCYLKIKCGFIYQCFYDANYQKNSFFFFNLNTAKLLVKKTHWHIFSFCVINIFLFVFKFSYYLCID